MIKFFSSSNAENIFLENIDDNCNCFQSDGNDEDSIWLLQLKLFCRFSVFIWFLCKEEISNNKHNCNWFLSDGSDEDPIYGLWFKLDRWKSMFGAHCEYLTSPLPQQLFVIIIEEM